MGIEALPTATVRTIGATQVLNDPASLVKELLDNALDAQSTSISIEIHSNTLDSIQVRDNGHGIPPEDRLLVARPHCTSKISGEDDLKAIGGTSLGFRGEALASAAEMSGSLTISTRVEGEEVATALKINQQGEVIRQDRASLPVGTTVKIQDFIKVHAVRKQVALKNAEKTLAKIKQTLKAYAFARPHVRLSLRVLKAKNDKSNWTYAPKPGGNAEDAAFKIVGTTCASQCTWSVIEDHDYTLQAFLPKQDAEVSKYSNIGPFLSVDARPVSAARGTPKQIVKIFREALKKANPKADGVKEPFLLLDVRCPTASYDANVEPAKDDVLFEDPDMLIGMVRQLFEAVYPTQETSVPPNRIEQPEHLDSQQLPRDIDEDDFITSLEPAASQHPAPKPWTPLPTDGPLLSIDDLEDFTTQNSTHPSPGRVFRANMYGRDDEDLNTLDDRPPSGHTEADFEELRQARHDVNVSNPWILAKMNAPVSRRPAAVDEDEHSPVGDGRTQMQQSAERSMRERDTTRAGLPTPGPSSPSKPMQSSYPLGMAQESPLARDGRFIGSEPLPPPGPTIMAPPNSDMYQIEEMPSSQRQPAPEYNYDLPTQEGAQVSGTPLHAIPDASAGRRQSPKKTMRQTAFKPPLKSAVTDEPEREKVWFDHLQNVEQRRSPKRPYQPRENNGLVVQGELGDLVANPRPLTPPRRNRDMRDFFTPRDQEAQASITDLVEARQYPQQRRAKSITGLAQLLQDADGENHGQPDRASSGAGFMPASELVGLEDRFGPPKPDASRPTKRRKTCEKRALREISGNTPGQGEATGAEYQAITGGRAGSTRRRTTDGSPSKSRRTKSSRLPLERVPKGQGTHSLMLDVSTDEREISRISGKIDEERSLLGWNQTWIDAYDTFATTFEQGAVQDITAKLHELLAAHVPDGEMVQDLGVIVQGAFAAHFQQALEMDA